MYNSSSNNIGTKKIKVCSINICGLSARSKMMMDKYVDDEAYDVVCVQETGTIDSRNVNLCNMNVITDTNKASNRGASIYINNKYSLTRLESISQMYKNIDSSWGLMVIENQRFIIGTVYVKLNYQPAVEETLEMLNKAQNLCPKMRAKGVILLGDFYARNTACGDSITNNYGNNLPNNLDLSKYTILTPDKPTFLADNGSSYIDLIITSNNLSSKIKSLDTDTEIELFSGAPMRGHVPLKCYIELLNTTEPIHTEKKIDLSKVCWNDWSNDLDNKVNDTDNPHVLWSEIDQRIKEVTMDHCEMKIICKHSKPFWTKTLTVLSNRLKETRKAYRMRNTDHNKNEMISAKEEFENARKTACQDFILNKTKELNSSEAQQSWKKFNQLFKKKMYWCYRHGRVQ